MNVIALQRGEIVEVGNAKSFARSGIISLKQNIGVGVAYLFHRGMRGTVGGYNTIAAEIGVTGHIHTIIASVGPILISLFILLQKTLVHPIPDKCPLQLGIEADLFPLCTQTAVGIAHCMRIFAWYHRTVAPLLAYLSQPLGRGVLGDIHIGIPFEQSPLIDDRTIHSVLCFLTFLNPFIGLVHIVSVAGFVAERENCNTGVVFTPLIHIYNTIQVQRIKVAVVAQSASLTQIVPHSVRLDISFVIDIKSQLIAQLIEKSRLGIVCGADCIDIVLTHQFQVFEQKFPAYIVTCNLVVFVDIHSFKFDRLSVDKEESVFDLKSAESHPEGDILIFHPHQQSIECRMLCRPWTYVLYFCAEINDAIAGNADPGSNCFSFIIQKFKTCL